MLNVVAIRGRLTRPAELRSLQRGTSVLGLELSVRRDGEERADTVPVVLYDPPDGSTSALAVDAEVVVVGHVARRFFRVGGGTQSRTEVVASSVHPARSGRRADAALRAAAGAIEAATAAGGGERRPASGRPRAADGRGSGGVSAQG